MTGQIIGRWQCWQPVEKVGVWSNFWRDDVFRRTAMTENLDLTPSFHFFNGLLRGPGVSANNDQGVIRMLTQRKIQSWVVAVFVAVLWLGLSATASMAQPQSRSPSDPPPVPETAADAKEPTADTSACCKSRRRCKSRSRTARCRSQSRCRSRGGCRRR